MATYGQSKSEGVRSMPAVEPGPAGDARSPGGTRHYPKGSSTPGNSQSAPFNPQKVAATDKYVGGV